jgi:DNA (cytosine-5)-methyltransferase 1
MIALDLFAGTGWGVACQALGIEEYGVEIMPEAVATRAANGMTTIYNDVWEGLSNDLIESRAGYGREAAEAMAARGVPFREIYEILIASPPCQTFSMAGGGAGRRALNEVLKLIDEKAYQDVAELRAFGEAHDPRTALVLTPLAHVFRDVPTYIVFEQVPPVLPVWERCAEEMRRWGYSVWTGIVNAEQYGVPQTRRRAILIARCDGGEAAMPTPTHSRYYSRDPKRLDPDVEPWVSMAEALGWGMTDRPFVTAGNAVGRAEGVGGSGGKAAARGERPADEPAPTMASKADRNLWEERPAFTVTGGGSATGGAEVFGRRAREAMGNPERVTVEEAAALQSYPAGFEWCGTKTKRFLQIGNAVPPLMAEAILKAATS